MVKRKSKNQIRREKAKLRKTEAAEKKPAVGVPVVAEDAEIEVEAAEPELIAEYANVFTKFEGVQQPAATKDVFFNDGEDDYTDSSSDDEETKMSKRQYRKVHRIPLSVLRASTDKPHLVEWFDADAPDPYMLIELKSQPNIVQVPPHWQAKRDYLSGRKGLDRMPFQLPEFIRATGIQEMRNMNDTATLKQQQRERVQPKMGKLDIDYQRLHDAFFKHQTKPRLFGFGDMYFEGRESTDEFSKQIVDMAPGKILRELRNALGMSDSGPPPWIGIMKEIGRPPAYENFLIPGLDVEYDNGGYRTKAEEEKLDDAIWGRPEEGEISEVSSDEEDQEEEPEPEVVVEETERQEITEFSKYAAPSHDDHTGGDGSSKQLYTIISTDTPTANEKTEPVPEESAPKKFKF